MTRTKGMSIYDGEERIVLEFVSLCMDDEPETDGLYVKATDGSPPKIQVRGSQTHFSICWTIMHELLHRWEDAADKSFDHDKLDDIARYLARVLTNSPRLLEYMKGEKGGRRGSK
jgi:hypothetical protein